MAATSKLGTLGLNRLPEGARGRLEVLWAPDGQAESASWAHESPQLPDTGDHVGEEKDAEHAEDRVEHLGGQSRPLSVSCVEGDAREPSHASLATRFDEGTFCHVDPDHEARWADPLRGGQGRRTGSAAGVKHAVSGTETDPIDDHAPEPVPSFPKRRNRVSALDRFCATVGEAPCQISCLVGIR
jgi:hypothetical protein